MNDLNNEIFKSNSLLWDTLRDEVAKVVVGQTKIIEKIFIGILSNGHILLEGAPGLAKTTLVRTISNALGLSFSRIQFTPDLLPSDVIGTLIYDPKSQDFITRKGPIFASVVLADEINRAPAKVQSALLEAMAEHQVTIGSQSYKIETPFIVLATQNPLEQQGTYSLPEAQIDRFMLKLHLDYPNRQEELEVVNRSYSKIGINRVIDKMTIETCQRLVSEVFCDDKIAGYILDIVRTTRPGASCPKFISDWVKYGASPRASIALLQAAKANAFLKRRNFVIPDDVKACAYEVLRHRIILTYDAEIDNITTEVVIQKILDSTKTP